MWVVPKQTIGDPVQKDGGHVGLPVQGNKGQVDALYSINYNLLACYKHSTHCDVIHRRKKELEGDG